MAIREIRLLGDPVLRQRAEPVAAVDEDVRRLIDDMLQTMYAASGVGLAAPQVGVPQRVLVVDVNEPDVPAFALVNPELAESGGERVRAEEGCLSIPGVSDLVERDARVVVQGLDREGEPARIEAEGLLARVLQHELDHLDGILFIDRLSPLKRQMLLRRFTKARKATK
jgi:peptide deformylase